MYAIAEMGGEGKVRAFMTHKGALQANVHLGKEGSYCEGLFLNDIASYHENPARCVVKGASKAAPPATVFLCCQGDRGCTVTMASAHLTLAEAEAAAAELNASLRTSGDDLGLGSYVCECDLEP